jgi:glycosyltransferase involved in cell wall biosynthesis
MKVMICIATMEAGGAERQVCYLAKGLVELGHEVHVVLRGEGPNFLRLSASGACIHRCSGGRSHLSCIPSLTSFLRRLQPDIAYLWQRPFDVLGGMVSAITRTPCAHAERTDPRHVPFGIKTIARDMAVRCARGVIANSVQGESYWQTRFWCPNRVFRIPNIIPFEELETVQESPESQGCLLAVGRLDANKNMMTLLRAAAQMHRNGRSLRVKIVGDGPLSDAMSSYIREQDLGKQIQLLGFRKDVWALMKGCDAFVSLSNYEGEPNVVLEACSIGCPLLLSDIPAHHCAEGIAGVEYVNANSVEDVVCSLEKISDRSRANRDKISVRVPGRSTLEVATQHIHAFEQFLGNSSTLGASLR